MAKLCGTGVFLVLFCVFVNFAHSLTYADLESTGIACPERHKCRGNRNDRPFYDKYCKCDSACHTYQDCCIDVRRRSSAQKRAATNETCLHYGVDPHSGIFAVSKCSSSWTGPEEIKQKCEGSRDFSDPFCAAPVISLTGSVTYKNLYCAHCNNADMNSLKFFAFQFDCGGSDNLLLEQVIDQLSYDEQNKAWGVNRVEANGKSDFRTCDIHPAVPIYLKDNVRFCQANIVSKCPENWIQHQEKTFCEEYMAVVYSGTRPYRNPHCALCNNLTISNLSCEPFFPEFLIPSAIIVMDINEKNSKTTPCPNKSVYDPYFKKCRELSCAFPGYVMKEGGCVPGG